MLKNGIAKKILLITIIAIAFLVVFQKAVNADEYWNGDADGLGGVNWWRDQKGETYSGENNGVKWIATITETDDAGDEVGRVSLKITNAEEISGEIKLPDKISGKGVFISSYVYEIETIETDAFRDAESIEKVTLGKYVKNIGNRAFYNCKSLKEIIISESVNTIGEDAFYNCSSLKEISIGENVNAIGEDAFYNCSSLDKVIVNQNNANFSNDEDGALFNKDKTKLIYYPTGKNIESYTIPNTVQYIGKDAFAMNQAIKSIDIPESVKEIYSGVFQNCNNLQKINFLGNSNINIINEGVFFDCKNLISIQIPESVTEIKKSAFASCESLKEIKLPSGLKTISKNLFENCKNLEKIELPTTLEVIDSNAFNNSGIKHIEIPQGTTTINNLAFYNSDLLTAVIPNTITTIGGHAFEGDKNLIVYGYNCDEAKMAEWHTQEAIPGYAVCEGVNINSAEDDLADYVEINKFVEGTATEIELLSHIYGLPVEVLDEASFKDNANIQKIKLPNTIKTMWDQVFFGCKSLNNVVLPKTIENIPDRAFANCPSLTKLVIRKGSAISSIGTDVFLGDSNSLVVYHDGENDTINTYDQNNANINIKIDNEAPTVDVREKVDVNKISATIILENIKDKEGGSGAELYVISTKENADEIEENEWKEVTSESVQKIVDENKKYYIYIADMVGNISPKTREINGLDELEPEIILDENNINYSRDGASMQLSFKEEENGSGLLKWVVSKNENIDEIAKWETISGYEQTVSKNIPSNGIWYIYVFDKAGNKNVKEININKIDNIPPVIGSIDQNLYKEEYINLKIHLEDNDSGPMSGLAAYAIDTKETIDENTEWIKIDGKPISKDIEEIVESNGNNYIHLKDDFGNVATKGFITEEIVDSIAPRIKFVDKTNNNIKIKITDAFSGIAEGAKISYGWSTTINTEPETYKPVELTYEAGAKEVIANVPCDGQGTYYLCLKIEELKDVAGNANTEGKIYSDSYEFDTVLPEIKNYVFDNNTNSLNNGKKVTFQLNFTEPVTLVETEELTISGEGAEKCIISEITPVSSDGLVWQFTLTGGTENGEAKINIPYGIFKDMTGNTLKHSYIITVTIDNIAPEAPEEIKVNDNILKQGQKAVFEFKFGERVSVNNDKFSDVISSNENANLNLKIVETFDAEEDKYKKWNLTFEVGTGDGYVEITLPKGFFRDELGNEVEPIGLGAVKIDNTLPKLEITQLETDDKNENVNMYSTREYMITSDEKLQINEGKIEIKAVDETNTITGKVVVEPNGTEGREWKVTVTEFEGDGLAKLVIPSGYFVDEAGNKNSFTEKNIVTVDNTATVIESIEEPYLDKETGNAVIEIKLQNLNKKMRYAISKELKFTAEEIEEILLNSYKGIDTDDTELLAKLLADNSEEITSNPVKIEVEEAGEYYIYLFDYLSNVLVLEPIKIEESLFDPLAPVISIEENEQKYIKEGDVITYKVIASEKVSRVKAEFDGMLVGSADDSVLEIKQEDEQWYIVVTAGSKSGDLTLTIPKGFFVNSLGKLNLNEAKVSLNVDNVEPTVKVNEISFDENTKKAKIEIGLENAEGKLQYVLSTSENLEDITEDWKEVTTNPFEIETEKAGIYYVYVEEEAGHIKRSEKINVSGSVFDNVPPIITVEGPEKVSLKNGQTVTYKLIPSEEVRATSDEGPIAKLTGNATDSNFKIYFDTEQKAWLAKITAGEINGDLSLIIPKGYFEDLADNKTQNDTVISGIMVDNTAPVITGITEPVLDETKEKAIIEVTLENADEKLEYVISTSDMVENITEEWKQITENPFKIEITEEGTYYVYIRDEAGNITKSEKIEITKEVFDIIPPTAEVKHEIVNGKLKVVIIANEEIQLLDGWNYANENKTIIERIFEQDTNEKVTVKDLANNSCEVNITVKLITKITLDKTQLTLEKGVSEKLTATIEPENVTNNQLVWTSSNNNVATVDNQGKVTAVSDGSATITVTTLEGNKTHSCIVTVKPDELIVVLKDGSEYEMTKEDETLYIENIEQNTKIEDVLKDIETNGELKIYKENDEETDKTKKIATGMIIKATKGTQEKTLIVVVKGDCNGSGTCNVSDLTKLKVSRAESLATNKDETKILTGAFARAMDFNKDGKLSASDITNLCKYIAENK